jgi:hypothetical protein
MATIPIQYRFIFADGTQEVFDLRLDADTLRMQNAIPAKPPPWTRLDFHQCPHCPLDTKRYPHCLLALNLVPIVERFGPFLSFTKMDVEVITQERVYRKQTSAQEGISSLMGLAIASSGCPLTDFFKPMARFHLPFANAQETIWRAISTYLLARYFLSDDNAHLPPRFVELAQIYDEIETLNLAIAKRLRAASKRDSAVNALVRLDVFAKHLSPPIEETIEPLRKLFSIPFKSNG